MTTREHTGTIGILGAGQLGLMLSESLSNLGARVLMLDPSSDSPAALRTAFTRTASFENEEELTRFFSECDRVTYEFEHIPTGVLKRVLDKTKSHHKLWPSLTVLENAQNRIAEKKALEKAHAPLTPWKEIHNFDHLCSARNEWLEQNKQGILKTVQGGYDGKGQWRLRTGAHWDAVIDALRNTSQIFPLVLEEECSLLTELSVIVARHPTLGTLSLPAVENIHVNGILDTTLHPPRLPFDVCADAQKIAEKVADVWDVFGLLTVEFFAVRHADGIKLLVNEVAPRPHNSGHVTRRSLSRSQFDILAQVLLDLPFRFQHIAPEETWAMWNTLGDLWSTKTAWWPSEVIGHGSVCEAMLYGKPEVRSGRKMGHIILRAADAAAVEKNIAFFRSTFARYKEDQR
jgi:5-(carboxyamino)imidazole ribonucleotide synthase